MYAQTILGPLWIVITAILSSSVLTLVFGKVADLSTDGVPQFLFYMAGNILWMDFSACISKLSGTFLSHANLMGKVYFPRICVPVAGIITRQIQFLIQFLVFLCVWFYYRNDLEFWQMSSRMLFIPVLFFGIAFAGFRMRTDSDLHHSKIQGLQRPCVICNTDLDVFVSCRISGILGTGKASDIVFVQSGCTCSGDMESDLVWDGHYSVASIGA